MRTANALDDIFRTRSHVATLRAMHGMPEGLQVSVREVARRAGLSHTTTSGVLERLLESGLVRVRRTLWADEYELNGEHVSAPVLRSLFGWEASIIGALKGFIRTSVMDEAPWISEVYLFGSVARGDMRANSDIDIAVICPARRTRSAEALMTRLSDSTRDRYGNRLEAILGTGDLSALGKHGRPGYRLWRQIALEGIPILHPEDPSHRG